MHMVPTEVGVHAGLPINEVFGFPRTVKDSNLNPHDLLHTSAMVLTTTIGIITLVVEVSIVVLTMRQAGVTPVVVLPIVGVGVVWARWHVLGNLTIIAGILRSGVVVSTATRVSLSADGVLAIVIIITGAGWIGSAVGIPMILSSVCGGYWCAITSIIAAIIVGAGTSQA